MLVSPWINRLCSSSLTLEVQLSPFASFLCLLCISGHGYRLPTWHKLQAISLLSVVGPIGVCSWEPRVSGLQMHTPNPDTGLGLQTFQDAWATMPAFLIILWSGRKSNRQIIRPAGRICNREKHAAVRTLEGKGWLSLGGTQGRVLGQNFNIGNTYRI